MGKRTIEQGFGTFLTRLTPSATETDSAKSHRDSINDCLKQNYTLKNFWRTGSFGNGTSVSGYSDVDYFACVETKDLKKKSYESLRILREKFEARFPKTSIKVTSPAVTLEFGKEDWEKHEIVLADYLKKENGYEIYDIADGNNGWMNASPDAHKGYIKQSDDKFNGKLRALIRFIKAWKYYCDVPIKSFYLELRTTEYALNEKYILYNFDIKGVLIHLKNKNLADIQDPMEVSGLIPACTDAQKITALSKIETAIERAKKAIDAEVEEKNIETAFDWWNKLFNGNFPSINN